MPDSAMKKKEIEEIIKELEPSDHEMKAEDFAFLKSLPGNDKCSECDTKQPDWGSPNLGILFCFQCSGKHRGLGTHISFVRSVTMDSWTSKQIQLMRAGGNQQCKDFLAKYGVDVEKATIREKYDTPAAQLYKQVLLARIEGRPEPTELPKPVAPKIQLQKKKMEGFGSSPPPSPRGSSGQMKRFVWITVPAVAVTACLWFLIPH